MTIAETPSFRSGMNAYYPSPRGHSVSACGELFASTILRKQGSMHLDEAGSLVATLGIPWFQPGVDVK